MRGTRRRTMGGRRQDVAARDRWVWDLWLARTASDYHMFFLQAPKCPGRSRTCATATPASATRSRRTCRPGRSCPMPSPRGRPRPGTTWRPGPGRSSSTSGVWHMLYTGCLVGGARTGPTIGLATSIRPGELVQAPRQSAHGRGRALVRATRSRRPGGSRHGAILGVPRSHGRGFHALITARASRGAADGARRHRPRHLR